MTTSGPPPDAAPGALDPAFFAAVERELHAVAEHMMRGERQNHTLQPTALLHEAWLRLSRADQRWNDHAHFVRTAARAMRRVLVCGPGLRPSRKNRELHTLTGRTRWSTTLARAPATNATAATA